MASSNVKSAIQLLKESAMSLANPNRAAEAVKAVKKAKAKAKTKK